MKNTDQIRQLLTRIFKIADTDEPDERHGYPLIKNLVSEVLIFFPCETCNGTKRKIMFQPGQREFGGDASTSYEVPCPDCQPKTETKENLDES
jgi:hypothetical protein